jgi:O-antigen/teichoic acid export membrane protein
LIIKLAALAGVVYFFLYLISPWFVSIYLGEKWVNSIEFIQILCLPFALQLVSNSVGGAFIVYKRQKALFYFKVFFIVLLTASIYALSVSDLTLQTVVLAYGAVLVVEEMSKIGYLIWITRYVGSN